MELWYFHHSYITSQAAVQQSEARIDQAVAAGYTGVVLWDTGINDIQYSWWDPSFMSQVIQYAQSKGLKVMPLVAPYGHSTDMLRRNPNWAEGERVVGTQFQVDPQGKTLQVLNSSPGLVNGGFESGKSGWFAYGDAGTTVYNSVSHSGSASGLISGALNPSANARFYQSFAVKPWRQYHMRMYLKTSGFQGSSQVEIFGDNNFAFNRVNQSLNPPATSGWTQWDYTFNSGNHTTMSILMGVWGGNQGNIWFDDITLDETALVYVLRGNSTPLNVYDPANPSHTFQEGPDFGAVSEPKFATNPTFDDYWHQPMTVPVPAGSSLKPGQIVAMDWYALQPEFGDAGASLTDPGPWQWMQQNAQAVGQIFPNAGGYFFSYDEMRHMNSTASAQAKNMTAGQLLAWHFGQVYNLFKTVNATKPIYVWSDMFDPFHNAVNNFYLVEGDLSGSWKGLPSDVIVMNWNLGALTNSTTWFSGLNPQQPVPYQQIIAGYYDSGNGASAASTELSQVAGIPGIRGMMYTTFADDYSQLAAFATAARTGWTTYQQSLGKTSSPATATFIKADATTQGNWRSAYGAEGYNVVGDSAKNPPYVTPAASGQLSYTWAGSTSDVRALQKASDPTGRIASTWYSPAYFIIDLNTTDQLQHQVALYCVDWDTTGRRQTVDVLDASGNVLNTQVLNTNFSGGVYLVWNVTGHVKLRVTSTGAYNAVVSGLFFGGQTTAPPPSATFVKADTSTQGNWRSVYGTEGYSVIGDSASIPSYAVAPAPSGNLSYMWAASTSDVRGLQKASNPSDRIASTWYSPTSFTIDLNTTDQLQHQVALYCVDWDTTGRRQTVDVLDPSGTVLNTQALTGNFNGGVYLVWNVTGHVKFRLTSTGLYNTVVSGLFFH
ncbi:MAG: putative glycosyl hydrolase [Bryobacterales bacterium]|nr:putative glycosyl hydrolase [Bryobacterales bacterium]